MTDLPTREECAERALEWLQRVPGILTAAGGVVPDSARAMAAIAASSAWLQLGDYLAPAAAAPAPSAAAAPGPDLSGVELTFANNRWRMKCPNHGWHAARAFEANKGKPACVKCTAEDPATGEYCDIRIPMDDARRAAGLA